MSLLRVRPILPRSTSSFDDEYNSTVSAYNNTVTTAGIIGIVIAAIVLLASVGGTVWFIIYRRRRRAARLARNQAAMAQSQYNPNNAYQYQPVSGGLQQQQGMQQGMQMQGITGVQGYGQSPGFAQDQSKAPVVSGPAEMDGAYVPEAGGHVLAEAPGYNEVVAEAPAGRREAGNVAEMADSSPVRYGGYKGQRA